MSAGFDGLKEANELIRENTRALSPSAVASQAVTMTIFSVCTVLVFNVLRPKNKIIYEPKVKYHVGDKPPPRISDSLLGWLPPLLHTKEPELVHKIGLDAVVFLRFLRMLRWLFTGISVLCCGILIPVDVIYNLNHVPPGKRDILTMLSIRDVSDHFLYAHIVASYLVTLLLCFIIYRNWVAVIKLRRQWFQSPEYADSFYARTLAIRHVPRKYQTDEGLRLIMESTGVPYPTTAVHIGRKVGQLADLIELHNNTVKQLEAVLVKYLKGGKIAKRRPIIRLGGFLGMGGQKKDAIDYYTAKLKRVEASIQEYRDQIGDQKAESYGFASLAAVPYAHTVAQKLRGKHPKGTDVTLAPNPKDIIWQNMNMTDGEIARKKMIGFAWLALVCAFNTIPLFFISILANLEVLADYVHFLYRWKDASEVSFTILSGILPPAVSALFGFFLPVIMRSLTRYMGALTHSRLDRAVIARYFFFLVISQLVIFTLIGIIFNSISVIVKAIGKDNIKDVLHNLSDLPDKINYTYLNQSSYWLTFFPMRGFLAIFDLAQIINLVWINLKTRLFGRTPRDIREWTQPPEFEYAIQYSNLLFMAAVGLVFAPLAPLVAVAAGVVFWMSSWVNKYQLMFVFISKVETGGRLWNVVVNRLLFCVVMMQALMTLTMYLQLGFWSFTWVASLPPILIVAIFKIYTNRAFDRHFRYYIPTEAELQDATVHKKDGANRLEKRFGHPSLNAELFTPMLHAKMMPLLGQVYSGKIGRSEAKMDEYGGKGMQASVVSGIKIAAIDQHDLMYDPIQYQRDRGELDWDARSRASIDMLNDGASTMGHKGGFYAQDGRSTPGLTAERYDRYLAKGAGHSEIELSNLDTPEEPLLHHASSFSPSHPPGISRGDFAVSLPPSSYNANAGGQTREAPMHRPQGSSQFYENPTYQSSSIGVGEIYNPASRSRSPGVGEIYNTSRSRSPGVGEIYNPNPSQTSLYPPSYHTTGGQSSSAGQGRGGYRR